VRQGECQERVWGLGNTVTAFVIRDEQVINALDEMQGSW
jgi:hypothetical protein